MKPESDIFEKIYTIKAHSAHIWEVEHSPVDNLFATCAGDWELCIWNTKDGSLLCKFNELLSPITSISWSPDGDKIAVVSRNLIILILKVDKNNKKISVIKKYSYRDLALNLDDKHLSREKKYKPIISWSPFDDLISISNRNNLITFINIRNEKTKHYQNDYGIITCLKWAKTKNQLLIGVSIGHILVLDVDTFDIEEILLGHSKSITDIDFSRKLSLLVSSSIDETIRVWDSENWRLIAILEGHTNSVSSSRFTVNDKFIISKSLDSSVRLWRVGKWDAVVSLSATQHLPHGGVSVGNSKNQIFLAKVKNDSAVSAWRLNEDRLYNLELNSNTRRYVNARVVLTGDTGVGKSGLSLVLTGKNFKPTDSTHNRKVWTFESQDIEFESGLIESREILLWDLAGQPGYRLLHQLHLTEVTVGVIVFDSRSETNPFTGVRHWARAIRQAQKISNQISTIPIILVAARTDRGGVPVSRKRISQFIKQMNFLAYIETSAKEGIGIPKLFNKIKDLIDWDFLPKVSSNILFQSIKQFIARQKLKPQILISQDDLYCDYLVSDYFIDNSENPRTEFETCIRLVESRGFIKRFSFGNFILLHPELLDGYASSMIDTAKREPDGLGCILEEDALEANFFIPSEIKITNTSTEKLLCLATVESLLEHELALKLDLAKGKFLVFPSQFTSDWNEPLDSINEKIRISFEGPELSIYAQLAVRLTYSDIFIRKEMWKNGSTFYVDKKSETFGIFLQQTSQGRGEISIFFDEVVNDYRKKQFEEYILTHIKRTAIPKTVKIQEVVRCGNCGEEIPPKAINYRKQKGFSGVRCSFCEVRVSISSNRAHNPLTSAKLISVIDESVYERKKIAVSNSIIEGKIRTNDYDVFISYQSKDRFMVERIARELKQNGILPWLDVWELRPGLPWMRELEKVISNIKSAVVFVGKNRLTEFQIRTLRNLKADGANRKLLEHTKKTFLHNNLDLGPWQDIEVEALLREFIKRKCPVIPAILPNFDNQPRLPIFLNGMMKIDFRVMKPDPFKSLIWGITGEKQEPYF